MRTITEKCEEVKRYMFHYCKRINDQNLVGLQLLVIKIKEMIDDEINRRAENLKKQGGL